MFFINSSLDIGCFPDYLKLAKIVPIYKKDDKHLFKNYRPISLLPTISKVFEKVVNGQLIKYLENNKLLSASQYGFRESHSTELAAIELAEFIQNEIDKNHIPLVIFLDFSKAFDSIDHNILLKKLSYYGIKDRQLNWFESYLKNREHFTSFKNALSQKLPISNGVPQGSILGPTLFLIYINDFCKASDVFGVINFADDSNLCSSFCPSNKHKQCLKINQKTDLLNDELC